MNTDKNYTRKISLFFILDLHQTTVSLHNNEHVSYGTEKDELIMISWVLMRAAVTSEVASCVVKDDTEVEMVTHLLSSLYIPLAHVLPKVRYCIA